MTRIVYDSGGPGVSSANLVVVSFTLYVVSSCRVVGSSRGMAVTSRIEQ